MAQGPLPPALAPTTDPYLYYAQERIAAYAKHSKADNTWRAYQSDFADFALWCQAHGVCSLPASPDAVAAYLTDLAPLRKVATLQRRLASISQAHAASGYQTPTQSPVVRLTMQGIRRVHAPEQGVRKVRPAVTSLLLRVLAPLTDKLIDVRDRALLLVGFAGAFRRSELAGLRLNDITQTQDGLRIVLRQSKTDQEGQGSLKGIPYGQVAETCPVEAWNAWVAASGMTDGQAFRSVNRYSLIGDALSDRAIANLIKKRVAAVGLNPQDFSGHSLRSGFITSAAQAGVSERSIARQSGHKSLPVLRGYIREGSLFTDNAAARVGL
jgi:site-specific recombinase XerD